jgi:hypothetical protein
LLYHNALSSGVAIEDILQYARKTKEMAAGDEGSGIAEMRIQLMEQERTIRLLLQTKNVSEIELNERTSLLQDKAKTSTGGVVIPMRGPPKASYGSSNPSDSNGVSVGVGVAARAVDGALASNGSVTQPKVMVMMTCLDNDLFCFKIPYRY